MNYYRLNRILKSPFVYLHNRWVNPSDRVVIRQPEFTKGCYHDADYVMLYILFQMVVDFVEIECAVFPATKDSFETRWKKIERTIRELPVLHWLVKPTRNPRRGLHYLRWCMKLKDHEYQRQFAKDIFKVYRFWVHERPARKDPYELYHTLREKRGWNTELTPKERKVFQRAMKLETQHEKEDERMLHLIIKNRTGLWT